MENKSDVPIINYVCKACGYETTIKYSYHRHELTEKHKQNIRKTNKYSRSMLIKKNKDAIECVDCGKIFAHQSGLSRHKKICGVTQTPVIKEDSQYDYKKLLKDKDLEIKRIQSDLEKAQKIIGTLVLHGKCYNNPAPREPSTTNYLSIAYNAAPPLKALTTKNVSGFWRNNDDQTISLLDILSSAYTHKRLIEFVGTTLLSYYKKDDPTEQSVWNTDAERLTYYIKEHVGWCADKKGISAAKLMIDPSLNYFRDTLTKYITTTPKRNIDVIKDQEKRHLCLNIINDINSGETQRQILKFMAPFLYIDKDKEMKELNDNYNKCLVENV